MNFALANRVLGHGHIHCNLIQCCSKYMDYSHFKIQCLNCIYLQCEFEKWVTRSDEPIENYPLTLQLPLTLQYQLIV